MSYKVAKQQHYCRSNSLHKATMGVQHIIISAGRQTSKVTWRSHPTAQSNQTHAKLHHLLCSDIFWKMDKHGMFLLWRWPPVLAAYMLNLLWTRTVLLWYFAVFRPLCQSNCCAKVAWCVWHLESSKKRCQEKRCQKTENHRKFMKSQGKEGKEEDVKTKRRQANICVFFWNIRSWFALAQDDVIIHIGARVYSCIGYECPFCTEAYACTPACDRRMRIREFID